MGNQRRPQMGKPRGAINYASHVERKKNISIINYRDMGELGTYIYIFGGPRQKKKKMLLN